MGYKKCEHCGEEIHNRSKKCPFCNQIVAEVVEEPVTETEEVLTENKEKEVKNEETIEETIKEENTNSSFNNSENGKVPFVNYAVTDGEPKDYVYKAEVRHSLEYTTPMSNALKVFLSAACTFPVFGQFIGAFIGVFFLTYEDTDRRSFGKALILLSVLLFLFYIAYFRYALSLVSSIDPSLVNSLLENY